jgi:putative NADPH-quinone reductase
MPWAAVAPSHRILVVNGNSEPETEPFCSAHCDAYEEGAQVGGWETERLNAEEFSSTEALAKIRWAKHITVIYPLLHDRPPAALQDLFERYECLSSMAGFQPAEHSARIVILMEMPAFAHRALLQNDNKVSVLRRRLSLRGLPCDDQLFIGGVGSISSAQRNTWLQDLHRLGMRGA